MSEGDGGSATSSANVLASNQGSTTSSCIAQVQCANCFMPFTPKPSNPDQKFCTLKCSKMANQPQNPVAAGTGSKPKPRQIVTRRNSLTSLSQHGTPQLADPVGNKRALSPTTTSPGPAHKKGKDVTALLNTLSQVSLSSLNKSDLITHLKSCMSHLAEMDTSDHLKRIRELESTVEDLKTELTDCKVAFADSVISTFKSRPSQTVPSIPQTISYADSVRGAVLVASFAKGEKPTVPLNIAGVEKLMDSQSNGLIPQNVKERDNELLITFNDSAEAAKAASVLKKQADCS